MKTKLNSNSINEVAAKVRKYARKNFPRFKFSIRGDIGIESNNVPSLYIDMNGGPVVAFVVNLLYTRGYGINCDDVEGFRRILTHEAFEALYSVVNYANSYRSDDRDPHIIIRVNNGYRVLAS